MLPALRSRNTIPTGERERQGRAGPSILSRRSDEAWKDHGHHHRSSTRRHSVPATQRAGISVHSSVLVLSGLGQLSDGFPARLHERHFWEPSQRGPDTAVLQSSLHGGTPHL